MNAALLKSERMDWNTPPEILDPIREAFGVIGLDPCPNDRSIVAAQCTINPFYGLTEDWRGEDEGLVFVNPPYGREIPKWTIKAAQEAARGVEIIMLIPARTDTRWFQDHVFAADAICFWKGRLTFLGAPAPAPFPSALVYWGTRVSLFEETFSPFGQVQIRRSVGVCASRSLLHDTNDI